ncbi:hypothetical protein KCU83_g7430, partial [Aureobasidium melanogenum]
MSEPPSSKRRKGDQIPQPVVEQSGDPGHPATFFSNVENENKTAGYLGLQHTSNLRQLAVTYPVLQAFVSFAQVGANTRSHTTLVLLADNGKQYDVDDAETKWPTPPGHSNLNHNKAARIATILIKLRQGLEAMANKTPAEAQKLQDEANATLSKAHPKLAVAVINHGQQNIQYFQHQSHASKNIENFKESGLSKGAAVKPDSIPTWLRPKAPGADTIPVSTVVTTADSLSKKSFSVVWFSKFDSEDLETALGEHEDLDPPSSKQSLTTDPRLFKTSMGFRDQIRRQYNCVGLHMQLQKCQLEYMNEGSKMHADFLQTDWEEAKDLLNDDKNSECVFKVGFYPLAEGDDEVFETDEHPNTEGFFIQEQGENGETTMVVDTLALEERAAAFLQAGDASKETSNNVEQEALLTFLDESMSLGKGAHDIGKPPNPLSKFAGNKEALLKHFDGKDVTNLEELRRWQKSVLDKISTSTKAASSYDQPKKGLLSKEAEQSIQDAQFYGTMAAEARTRKDDDEKDNEAPAPDAQARRQEAEENERYYTLRSAYSGTQAQTGPPLDLCLQVLACEKQPSGLYKSKILEGATKSHFYHYQISGAIGCILKLYGKIDVDKLLSKTPKPYDFDVEKVKAAADKLHDLLVHGVILGDDVGFGKTKQGLLTACLYQLLDDEQHPKHSQEILHKPALLVVPSSLIHGWMVEIRNEWPCFDLVVSFDDHNFKKSMGERTLTRSHMANFPASIPDHLKWAFDQRSPSARRALIITSYETHKTRTVERVLTLDKLGEHFEPKRRKANGTIQWKTKPKYSVTWKTAFANVFGLLVADEAQKIKNFKTGLSAALFAQNIRKTVLMTATPFHNHVRDLLGLTHLISSMAAIQLKSFLTNNEPEVDRLKEIRGSNEPFERLDSLERTDPLRLYCINAKMLMPIVTADQDVIHKLVMAKLKPVLETVMIRRSASSELPVTEGEPIQLRGMFKKFIRKTVSISRNDEDELEYQLWHREAASEFTDQLKSRKPEVTPPPAPGQPVPVSKPAPFALPMGPLRKLSLANFSTKMARLDATMERLHGNTHVATLQKWREAGKEAEFLVELTRGAGETKPQTAAEIAQFLAKGSPTMSLVCREILAARIIDPLDPEKYKQHQKLIIGEATPANAYWIMSTLRALNIDARILHAGLSNKAKAEMVDMFNNPKSSLKVLIMMYDVGAYGLNLHEACNRILITSIARAFALEEQLCGRTNRITSIFNTFVTRRFIPNSHDIFRSTAQADKATVQLATNAQDPSIRQLMIVQLQKLQTEVDACHASPEGQALKQQIVEYRSLHDHTFGVSEEASISDMRSRLRPRREKTVAYEETCSRCDDTIPGSDGYLCQKCFEPGHASCHGLDEGTSTETPFLCKTCVDNGILGSVQESALTSGGAMVFDDPEEVDLYVDTHEEVEDVTNAKGRSIPQQRAEEQYFDEDFDLILGSDDLAQFASDKQPDDEDRRRLVLLSIEPNKTWEDKDLELEKNLRIGLLLLFNMIQGKGDLAISRSIHIHYDHFSKKARNSVMRKMKATKEMKKEQEKWMKV